MTAQICERIASVYQENSPESIYFLMLYNIFNEFLDDIDEDVLPNDRTGYQPQAASRFQSQMPIHQFARALGNDRQAKAIFRDDGRHLFDGMIVLARIADVLDQPLDRPVLELQFSHGASSVQQ